MGLSLTVQGVGYLQSPIHGVTGWGLAALAFTTGVFLLAGLMTPLVAILVAISEIGIALAWIPLPGQDLFGSYLAMVNLIVLSIAIALLGPGAFSLDARMFGRREITIPKKNHLDHEHRFD